MKIVAYLERPASADPDTRYEELFRADRIRRVDGRVMIASDVSWLATLAHNLAVAGFGALMFGAGDNFGFHMGEDQGQCTCQWSPNVRGDAYGGPRRCEQHFTLDIEEGRGGCVLGAECLNPHIDHTDDECFDAEMARSFYGSEGEH